MLDRGQMYGDGFFETMLMINGNVPLIGYHFERMLKTALKLKLELPEELKVLQNFKDLLNELVSTPDAIRIRLNVIRDGNGFYLPHCNKASYNFNVQPAINPLNKEDIIIHTVGIAKSVSIYSQGLSNYKLLAKAEQVLLSIECKDRSLEDLIVLNEKEEVVECIYSNIFFIAKDGLIVTPPLESGCLDGCMRRYLINEQLSLNLNIIEKPIELSQISTYIACFITNSISGIKSISSINNYKFEVQAMLDCSSINRSILELYS